jgi:hypothetical protein
VLTGRAWQEANILNPRNGVAWAMLADLSLRQGRTEEASAALQQALACHCPDTRVLRCAVHPCPVVSSPLIRLPGCRSIGEQLTAAGQFRVAEGVLRRALADLASGAGNGSKAEGARLQAALGAALVEVRETQEAARTLRQVRPRSWVAWRCME